MRRKLVIFAAVLLGLVLASLLSIYSYGRFAKRVQGELSWSLPAESVDTPLDRLLAPLTQANPGRNGLALVIENVDAFAVRAFSARHAGRSLDLIYYLWHRDLTGRLLVDEVLKAADRGVRVRVLLDDINAHGVDDAVSALNTHPNVQVRLFNPSRNRGGTFGRAVELLLRGISLNRRMHNKAWIADGRLAIVGGRNIGDEYFDAAEEVNFLDADMALVGPTVAETAAIFDAFWNSPGAIPVEALTEPAPAHLAKVRTILAEQAATPQARSYLEQVGRTPTVRALQGRSPSLRWVAEARVYSDPPDKAQGGGRETWLVGPIYRSLREAQTDVRLISPYFVPGRQGTQVLTDKVQRGLHVGVLTNSLAATDVMAVHSGYARYRRPLLQAGVELRELMSRRSGDTSLFGSSGASLHTKAFIVDQVEGFVGSFNLDPRSIQLNTEMGVFFRDADLAAELLGHYARKSSAESSYRLFLDDAGKLHWEDARQQPAVLWTRDPEASFWRRLGVRILSWLPIEQQL